VISEAEYAVRLPEDVDVASAFAAPPAAAIHCR
jgi:hypothetical protein